MTTPRKSEILEKAVELWFNEQWQNGLRTSIVPTEQELAEGGYVASARSMLMRNKYRSEVENKDYLEDVEGLRFDVKEAMQTGVFCSGTSGSGKTNLMFHVADRLMQKGVTVYVVDPSQVWEKGSNVPNVLRVTFPMRVSWQGGKPEHSTVFDVSRLTFPQRMQFANLLCKTLLDKAKASEYDPETFVIFEECQLYFYQGSMRSLKQSDAIELVTNGRNYNIRYGIITQFPSMIDKLLIKMTKQKYFGWTNEKNDVEYIQSIIGRENAQELEKLETGEFIYSYPVRGHGTKKIETEKFERQVKPRALDSVPIQKREVKPRATKNLDVIAETFFAASMIVTLLMILLVMA
jgi:hypothetical protein